MPAIDRKTQKIFGSSLTPTNNVAVWGSLAASAPAYSSDPALIQSSRWLTGFNDALIGNRSPALEDLNGLMLVITQQLAYLLQSGVPQWDEDTTYFTNQFVRSGADLYLSLSDDNIGHAVTDTNNWIPYTTAMKGPAVCAAWVVFDGINESSPGSGNARILESYNVATVTRNTGGLGRYTVNFASALPSANYVMSGSCGTENGQLYGGGDSGVVVGNVSGVTGVRSASSCRVFTIDSSTLAGVQSGCVSVLFFGR